MDYNQLVQEVKTKLGAASEHLRQALAKIRTGRAHSGMLDGISVEVYGQPMPLKAVAGISTPEAQLLQITPFDPNNLKAISDAIRENPSLGLNPADDGRVVRIQIPPLTEETRKDMVKIVGQKLEEAMIAARNARHDALHKAEQDKQFTKDDHFRLEKQLDELLAAQKAEADKMAKSKEQEILTV